MLNQIRSEWIKLRSVRSTVVMFIVAIALSAFFAGVGQVNAIEDVQADEIFFGILFSQIFFMVLGVQIIGQEYRFKTIRATFAATPKRLNVIFAKLIVLIATVLATTLILMALSILVAYIVLSIQGFTIDFGGENLEKFIAGIFASSAFFAMFGFAVGAIVKQPIAGIVLTLIYALVVENIVSGILQFVLNVDFYKWLPFTVLARLTNVMESDFPEEEIFSDYAMLSLPVAYLYSTLVFGVLFAIGAILIKYRDA